MKGKLIKALVSVCGDLPSQSYAAAIPGFVTCHVSGGSLG